MTHSIEILVAAYQAITAGVHMRPRSSNDKEYSIHLDGKTQAVKHRIARTDAGLERSFDVFECR